ncbi:hypothetical protein D3C72_1415170 [compost metagenome]
MEPPAGKGTISVMGLVGKSVCALAASGKAALVVASNKAARQARRMGIFSMMGCLQWCVVVCCGVW